MGARPLRPTLTAVAGRPPAPRPARPIPSPLALRQALPAMAAALQARVCLVGGYPRDLLLGREPRADLDLVVEGAGAGAAAEWLRRHWRRPEPVLVFERFGTAQLACRRLGADLTVEFVQARSEAYRPESRKPSVRPGTLAEDIWRRDFTVNTLLLDGQGVILDLTGHGLDDLRRRLLRTPLDPEETFAEDPLRMLRAARFAAQLDFEPAPGLAAAMRRAAGRIRIVSVERIRDELLRLVVALHPVRGLRLLRDTGLLAEVAPELQAMVGVEQGGYHVGDVFEHTALACEVASPTRLVRLGALCHDIGKPVTAARQGERWTFHRHAEVGAEMARAMLRRWRLGHEEADQVAQLVRLHMRPIQYRSAWEDRAVRRLWHDAGPLVGPLLEVARADTRASRYPSGDDLEELARRLEAVGTAHPQGLRPALDGHQLKRRFGWPDGPWIGRAQAALVEAALEGTLQPGDPDDAEAHLRRELARWAPRAGERGGPAPA